MRTHHDHRPGWWPGLILISVGGGLLARELGLLPPEVHLVDFWPLLLVFMGLSSLFRARGFMGALFALAFVATGGLLLAHNLGFLAMPTTRLWPGFLVLLGLAFLIRRAHTPERREPPPHSPANAGLDPLDDPDRSVDAEWGDEGTERPRLAAADGDRLNKQVTLSGLDFKIGSRAWKGGQLGVTAGGVELDLRYARLDPVGAVLDVTIVMGGVDLRVPDTWQVQCDVTVFLGGADDTTRSTQGSDHAPLLRVVGSVTLGGLTIRN